MTTTSERCRIFSSTAEPTRLPPPANAADALSAALEAGEAIAAAAAERDEMRAELVLAREEAARLRADRLESSIVVVRAGCSQTANRLNDATIVARSQP